MRGQLAESELSLAFLLTGVGMALLGAALPAMLSEWQLTDRTGGTLLFSAFAGTTVGALLVWRSFRLLAGIGLALTAEATLYLSHTQTAPSALAFFVYGVGLGLTMTAISLLRARAVLVRDSLPEMNRLNLLWAIGACLAPLLAAHSLHTISIKRLFEGTAWVFGGTAALVLLMGIRRKGTLQPVPLLATKELPYAPPRLWLFAGTAVAVEAALGSWLATYGARLGHESGTAVWANSSFWIGLLASRAAHSVGSARWLGSPAAIRAHLAAVAIAAALLTFLPGFTVLPLAAFLAGAGLGPLYPLALSLALPHYRSGSIFIATGVGTAVLPWLTGVLSTASGSLRAGLLAPCATVVILLGAGLALDGPAQARR